MSAASQQLRAKTNNGIWYLGIDLGTTGISAVLRDSSTVRTYPLYWSRGAQIASKGESIFRLPTIIYSGPGVSKPFVKLPLAPEAVKVWWDEPLTNNQPGIFLDNLKPYLDQGIPYYCGKHHQWQPQLQLSAGNLVSIYWLRQAVQELLATLTPASTLPDSELKLNAVDLSSEKLRGVLGQLSGVIISSPTVLGDTYRFNLREAILTLELVKYPEQIFFLEDGIAAVLAGLASSQEDGEMGRWGDRGDGGDFSKPPLSPQPWQGGTLAINIGAMMTEFTWVDLPDDWSDLNHDDFCLRSFAYAGNAIDQDIFCQLLYPQMSPEQLQKLAPDSELELPLPAQVEREKRDRLVLLLHGSNLGRACLKAAQNLKLILPVQKEYSFKLGSDKLLVKLKDLEDKVFFPVIKQLNQELNFLLVETGASQTEVRQVVCIGGTSTWLGIKRWLQQKLPEAKVTQENNLSNLDWVATGLASLPLYPQVLNLPRQQYSDYFLLLELLNAFSKTRLEEENRSYSIKEIMQRLERRGLNTSACYERLIGLIKGHLPNGLEQIMDSREKEPIPENQDDLAVNTSVPISLFSQDDGQLYRPNLQQHKLLRQHLNLVFSGTNQKCDEPLIVRWKNNSETFQ